MVEVATNDFSIKNEVKIPPIDTLNVIVAAALIIVQFIAFNSYDKCTFYHNNIYNIVCYNC